MAKTVFRQQRIATEKPSYRELAPKSNREKDSINSQSTECGDPGSDECR
jgi:hypothetical protein